MVGDPYDAGGGDGIQEESKLGSAGIDLSENIFPISREAQIPFLSVWAVDVYNVFQDHRMEDAHIELAPDLRLLLRHQLLQGIAIFWRDQQQFLGLQPVKTKGRLL